MEVKSKDYKILINRLRKEIERHYKGIRDMQNGTYIYDDSFIRIHQEYIKYHEEMIKFIKKLDEESDHY